MIGCDVLSRTVVHILKLGAFSEVFLFAYSLQCVTAFAILYIPDDFNPHNITSY